MTAVLLTVFTSALLGSLHCAGMCGGVACFFAGTRATTRRARLKLHAVYQGGRLAAYLSLGAAAGALGAGMDAIALRAGAGKVAAAVAGTVMLSSGVILLLRAAGFRVAGPRAPASLSRFTASTLQWMYFRPPAARAGLLGLCSGLLPCGFLWAFVVVAAGSGSWVRGALIMSVFWLGAVPALLAVGEAARTLAARFGKRLPLITGATFVCVGLFTVLGRASMPVAAGDEGAGTNPGPAEAPCHGH